MVVESLDTAVADPTVDRTGWTVDVAGVTIFDFSKTVIADVQVFFALLFTRLVKIIAIRMQQKLLDSK